MVSINIFAANHIVMKYLLSLLFLCFATAVQAQGSSSSLKIPALDQSPMDMIYFPANYPVLKIQEKTAEPPVARVIYSRPLRNNRVVFGDLLEYGKVWRLGANEATEIEFFRDVKIANKKVPKGRYTLYAVIQPENWTMIINKDTDTWGSFKYDEKKDVLRAVVPVTKTKEMTEAFTVLLDKHDQGMALIVTWEDVRIALPIALK